MGVINEKNILLKNCIVLLVKLYKIKIRQLNTWPKESSWQFESYLQILQMHLQQVQTFSDSVNKLKNNLFSTRIPCDSNKKRMSKNNFLSLRQLGTK